MTAYVDASVVLRLVLGQQGALAEWPRVDRMIASSLVEVECLRALDRYRVYGALPDAALARFRATILRILQAAELVAPDAVILARAAEPSPTSLGALDAIHLATARCWLEENVGELVMATHDPALGIAARAMGMSVVGIATS